MRTEAGIRDRLGRTARAATGPLALAVALTLLLAAPVLARQRQDPPLEVRRLAGPIDFDGVPDEPAWEAIDPLPLTMYAPIHRGTPEQRTEIRVAYDDEHLYASGRFFDSEPDGIRVNSLYRDRWNGDDAFAIYIDAFNDNQTAKWFGTTPSGMRFDLLVSDDGGTINSSWDTFWDSRTRRTSEGWFVEVRIPFSSLGFQVDAEGRAVMGLTVTRLVSRTGERVTFPDIDPSFAFRQPSVARDIVLRDVRSRRPVYVTPYVLGGLDRRVAVPAAGGGFESSEDVSREIGLDVRYPLSGNLNLDVTVNTDFAQVEADDEQVNLDRFPLFFPEKRRFFQEGSGIFDFYTGAQSRLFHSRRIGLTDGREPVPVIGGARLVGRLGDWDLGFLNMHTEALGPEPAANWGVARVRRRAFNPYSSLGAMFTSRLQEGRRNVAGGADALLRVVGDHYLTVNWATSSAEAEPDSTRFDLFDRSIVYVNWQHRVNRGPAFEMSASHAGEVYDPGAGFLARRDYSTLNGLLNWYVFTDDHPWLRRIWPGALAFTTFRNDDGSVESGQYAVWVQWETKRGGGGWIEPKVFRESVRSPFLIGGEAEVPAGEYTFADLQIALQMSSGDRLRSNLDVRAGSYFDGNRIQVRAVPTWNVSKNLELGGDYLYSRIRFPDRGAGTDIHLAGLRLRTALDAKASGNALIQYNSTTDRLDVNVRLRYNFAEGTDLWLVYNEGLDTQRELGLGGERPPLSRSRSLILKYSQTFSP